MRARLRSELVDTPSVAVMLPPGVAGGVTNIALCLGGRTSVNLNYTMPNSALQRMCERASVEQVITSRRFLEALGRESPLPEEKTIYAENLAATISRGAKLRAFLVSKLPAFMLARIVAGRRSSEEVATILFSSGSSGEPKGVELTHSNVLSNVQSAQTVLPFGPGDTLLGILPLFHSFGYTVTLWTALLGGARVFCHPNPLDSKRIAKIADSEEVTVVLATPTFYQAWMRRIPPEAFRHVRLAISGAEKLRPKLAEAWFERYGVPLLEGYGCTECSPVVSFNLPEAGDLAGRQQGHKAGTLGRPLPGVALRVVDRETGEPLTDGEEGLLEVKGPNIMRGYLRDPQRTREALHHGWYSTGDVARIDRDGFLVITDRLARFSKIGGEMVPHGRVEDELTDAVARLCKNGEEPVELAVTSVDDEKKGEQLVVLHTKLDCTVDELVEELGKADLPALFVPRVSNFLEVGELPKLGTGKLDLKGLREVARTRLAG